MKKRIFSRVLALFMALSLLSTTAFAASFSQLQDAINGKGDTKANLLDGGYYGYAQREDESYGITAKTNEDGSREVNLHEDVVYTGIDGTVNKDKTWVGTGNKTVILNMNGNSIDGGYSGEKGTGNGANMLTVDTNASLTINGAGEDGKRGTITGAEAYRSSGAIYMGGNAEVKLQDVNLTSNYSTGSGGAICSYFDNGTITLTNVDLIGNHADGIGGAIYARNSDKVTLTNVNFRDNSSNRDGGAITIHNEGSRNENATVVEMTDCEFTRNTAGTANDIHNGNAIHAVILKSAERDINLTLTNTKLTGNNSETGHGTVWLENYSETSTVTLNMVNSEISGNKTDYAAGLQSTENNRVIMDKDSKIYNNTAKYGADDISIGVGTEVQLNLGEGLKLGDRTISGWYFDRGANRWSADKVNTEFTPNTENGLYTLTEGLELKAAHNKYYEITLDSNGGSAVAPSEAEHNNPFTVPENPTREGYTFAGWTLRDGTPFDFTTPATDNVELVATWNPVGGGSTGTTIPGADIPLGDLPTGGADAATTTIEDEETPLAGLFTRADAIGYLWEQTGSPEADLSDFEDVPEDHYWAVAIGWAQDMGIALPDEDGNFRPDDLVLRTSDEPEGELQEFLNRYAVFAGVELEDGELFIELDGEAEDFIMGEEAQVIFDEFFAKLESALAAQAA